MLRIIISFEEDTYMFQTPGHLTVGQLLIIFRKKMSITSKQAMFLLHDNTLLQCSHPLSYYSVDGKQLELRCKQENAFG